MRGYHKGINGHCSDILTREIKPQEVRPLARAHRMHLDPAPQALAKTQTIPKMSDQTSQQPKTKKPASRRADGLLQGPRLTGAMWELPARPALPTGELNRPSPEKPLSLPVLVRWRVLIRIGSTR